jgi:hypothetical protein
LRDIRVFRKEIESFVFKDESWTTDWHLISLFAHNLMHTEPNSIQGDCGKSR